MGWFCVAENMRVGAKVVLEGVVGGSGTWGCEIRKGVSLKLGVGGASVFGW